MGAGGHDAVPGDWWRSFFESDYDLLFTDATEPPETERSVNDLVALVDLRPGMRVLDAPGGGGRHAVPLALLGCHVTVVDRSPALLARARAATDELPVDLRVVRADLRRPLDLPPRGPHGAPFDLVANLFNSFGYFADPRHDEAMLGVLAGAVAPGGRLVMEVANPAALLAQPRREGVRVAGATVIVQRSHDAATRRLTTVYRVEPDDGSRPRTTGTIQRLHDRAALVAMARAAGLDVETVLGDLDGREPADEHDWLVLVARG